MIDPDKLLATLKPLVTQLEDSVRERALSSPEIGSHLDQEHRKAVTADRTAMSLEEWRDGEITQAAVAWVLGCVFVRFLEDNGLIDQALISGPGGRRAAALGHREEHFRAHPDQSDREYLEACFRTVATLPAVAPLYDERHNPLWRLGPTADGARTLHETFADIDPASGALVHDFSDPSLDTRFLGDLYQDISDTARKRYALLQTPEFVEHFILDHTLTPAISEFGLAEVRLIDPTCGSGHFLIGAFERLFPLWQMREPATSATVLAQRALDQIAGIDLNPYATAIARFRLVVAALRACGITRLAEAPGLRVHLATGDSLLHGPLPNEGATMLFDANRLKSNISHVYESEDAADLKEILGRGYHAVVGNPPYIAVQDTALRDAYRSRYASCHGKYVMTVPFMERFFELARTEDDAGQRTGGFIGKITGNNFMKREFGVPLVEKFLPSVDVQTVIDASGAYIPGHGTPTVILFGRSRQPRTRTLQVLDAVRAEPTQPKDPALGRVFLSIQSLIDQPGSEDEFIRCSVIDRTELLTHPMTLGIGRELKKRLEKAAAGRLGSRCESIGITAVPGEDGVYLLPDSATALRRGLITRPLVAGDLVRDYVAGSYPAVWTFEADYRVAPLDDARSRLLWPAKRILEQRKLFGVPITEKGLAWYQWGELHPQKLDTLSLTCAFVATHNHFALERGSAVFKQTAPVVKLLPPGTEEEYLRIMAALNSAVMCFYLKQVCHDRGSGGIGGGIAAEPWERFYELSAARLAECPLPVGLEASLTEALDSLAHRRFTLLEGLDAGRSLDDELESRRETEEALTRRLISLQEELDWQVMAAFGVTDGDDTTFGCDAPPIGFGQRAFEIALGRQIALGHVETTWFERHGAVPITEAPVKWPPDYRETVERRIALIESDPDVGLIERPEHKRRWARRPWNDRVHAAIVSLVLDALEAPSLWSDLRLRSTAELTDDLRKQPRIVEALDILGGRKDVELTATVDRLVAEASVPYVSVFRLTDAGMRKRAVWERVWDLQRLEDRIDARTRLPEVQPGWLSEADADVRKAEEVGVIPVPPRYGQGDFRSAVFWILRGKLDVSKERFTLVPGGERGADRSPVVGWAGWNERDLALALAARITELRDQEAARGDRLMPLLAGVLELLPWIHQWHPESDPLYGGTPGDYFEGWLDGQLAELAVTRDNLRVWRPPVAPRGRKAKGAIA
jgi:hypothetical protein